MGILFRYFGLALLALCFAGAQAAFVVVGNTKNLKAEEKLEVYRALVGKILETYLCPADVDALNAQFKHQGITGIRVIFTPDTTYHVLESELIYYKKSGSGIMTEITVNTKNPEIQYDVNRYKNRSFKYSINMREKNVKDSSDDFWALNDHIASFGDTSSVLENEAAMVLIGQSFIKNFMPFELYGTIIQLEKDAYENKKVVLWRFSQGIPNHPGWVDSIFDMSTIDSSVPILYKTNGCGLGGLSYSAYPLDHCLFECTKLLSTNPFVDLTYDNAPSSALMILLYNRDQLRKLKENANKYSSRDVKNRLETLKRHTLYALSIPQTEWRSMSSYVYDCKEYITYFIGLRSQGDLNHHRIHPEGLPEDCDEPKVLSYSDMDLLRSHIFEKHSAFVRTFYRWMAEYMKVLFTNNAFVSSPADYEHISNVYSEFYAQQLPGVLSKLGDTHPLYPLQQPLSLTHSYGKILPQQTKPLVTAMERLGQLVVIKDQKLLGIQFLLTGIDPLTGYEYGFRVKGPSANHQEKREIIAGIVATVLYHYIMNKTYISRGTHREYFNKIEKDAFPNGFRHSAKAKGYTVDEMDKIDLFQYGHHSLVRSCTYAISAIFQNQKPQWDNPLKEQYFDDLYAPDDTKVHPTFASFVNSKRQEFNELEH